MTTATFLLTAYLFWVNVIAFWAYAMDKHYAHYNLWRTPEAVLVGLAAAGGAYGAGAAMLLFRHKTLHRLFTISVPLCFILWTAVFYYSVISPY